MFKVKKQHFVPQFYLSQWAIENNPKQIYVFNKENSKVHISNIRDVASAKYFYDYPQLEEEQKNNWIEKLKNDESLEENQIDEMIKFTEEQIIEKALGELESYNAPIIDNIIQKLDGFSALPLQYFLKHHIFTKLDITELSYYIATQYARTKETRIMIEQMTKVLVKHISDFTLLNIDKLKNDTELLKKMGKENFDLLAESVKNGKFTKDSYTIEINENFTKINHIQIMFQLVEDIANILVNYKWVILVNYTSTPFYTSDSPVVKRANLNHPAYSYGFSSKGIEVIFPISPNYAINILEPSYIYEKIPTLLEHTLFDCSEENVIHYNDLIVKQATSQVYSNQNDFKWAKKRVKETPAIANKNRQRIKG
jgi:hypothetical protein